MDLDLGNTRTLALTPARSTVTMTPIVAQGERGEQGLPGVGSAAWTAATAVTTGTTRQAPDGSWIKSKASRTTRASFDATEEAFWEVVFRYTGTLEQEALDLQIETLGDTLYARQDHTGVDVVLNGVLNDGSDQTTAIHVVRDAAAAFGADLYFPPGDYGTVGLLNNVVDQHWHMHDQASIFFIDGAGDGAGVKQVVKLTANGTGFFGKIDGNRDGQNKAAFNAAGGSDGGRATYGLLAIGSLGSPLTDLEVEVEVVNSIEMGVYWNHVTDSRVRARVSDSGAGTRFRDVFRVDLDVTCRSIDNDGWKVYAHVCDIFDGGQIELHLESTDHFGDGYIAAGTALEDYIVGCTIFNVDGLRIDGATVETRNEQDLTRGVGFSLLGIRNMTAVNVHSVGYSDALMELGGIIDSAIFGLVIDGRYQEAVNGSSGRGVAQYNNAFVPSLGARVNRYTENFKVYGFTIRRCLGHGIDHWAARNVGWYGGDIYGCQVGIQSKWAQSNAAYAANSAGWYVDQTVKPLAGGIFGGVNVHDCEMSGAEITDGSDLTFDNCNFPNNGQAISFGSTRSGDAVDSNASGLSTRTSAVVGLSKTGIEIRGGRADDTQSFSGYVGPNPSDPTQVVSDDDTHLVMGRTISFTGAGVETATVKRRVNDVNLDVITLDAALVTLATVAGTGTISSAGGSTAVTGVGTNFDADFTARFWITAAGQTRQFMRYTSDTAGFVDTAFSPALSAGTSFVIYKTAYTGVPSQKYGYDFSADTISPILDAETPTGNTSAGIRDNTVSATPLRRPPRGGNETILGTKTFQGAASQATVSHVIKAGSSQSGDLLEFHNSSGGVLSGFTSTGTYFGKVQAAGFIRSYASKSANYSVTSTDDTIDCDATSAAFTVTMPSAVGRAGQLYQIRKKDASVNAVHVASQSSQTFNGAASPYDLTTQYQVVRLQSDGANWIIL